jgi:NADH-quinone oxidoreductase subunit L
VLEAAYAAHSGVGMYAFVCGLLAAFLTAFYSWRLIILTFHGAPRADHHTMEHVHESPLVMLVPLLVLAAGAIATGASSHPLRRPPLGTVLERRHRQRRRTTTSCTHAHEVPSWVPLAPTVVGLSGIALAYLLYMFAPGVPAQLAATSAGCTASC